MVLLPYLSKRVEGALTWLSPIEIAVLSDWVTVDSCLCLCMYWYVLSAGTSINTSIKITARLPVMYHINQGILFIQNIIGAYTLRKVQPFLRSCLRNFCVLNIVYAHILCRSSGTK
jgi:hypothetical protein